MSTRRMSLASRVVPTSEPYAVGARCVSRRAARATAAAGGNSEPGARRKRPPPASALTQSVRTLTETPRLGGLTTVPVRSASSWTDYFLDTDSLPELLYLPPLQTPTLPSSHAVAAHLQVYARSVWSACVAEVQLLERWVQLFALVSGATAECPALFAPGFCARASCRSAWTCSVRRPRTC